MVAADQAREEESQEEKNIADTHPNPFSPIFESDILFNHMEDPLNVPSDSDN